MINDRFYTQIHPNAKNTNPRIHDIREVTYVGITNFSIEINFADESSVRITNPEFLKGLKIEERIPKTQ